MLGKYTNTIMLIFEFYFCPSFLSELVATRGVGLDFKNDLQFTHLVSEDLPIFLLTATCVCFYSKHLSKCLLHNDSPESFLLITIPPQTHPLEMLPCNY